MKNSSLMEHITSIVQLYHTRGFKVGFILGDGQFESLRGDIADLKVQLNIVSNDEHVPEIELYIRTIKDRTQSIYNVFPFKHYPPLLIIEMVYNSVFWRNMFVLDGGISPTMSPSEIVLGCILNFHMHCRVEFGQYVQTHEEHNNSIQSRTISAIALRPTRNIQGSYFFMSLNSGLRINRRTWTPLPMPAEVGITTQSYGTPLASQTPPTIPKLPKCRP
jgi:hypothetical protein